MSDNDPTFGADGGTLHDYLPSGEGTDFPGERYHDEFETVLADPLPRRATLTFDAFVWAPTPDAKREVGRIHFWAALKNNGVRAPLKL